MFFIDYNSQECATDCPTLCQLLNFRRTTSDEMHGVVQYDRAISFSYSVSTLLHG